MKGQNSRHIGHGHRCRAVILRYSYAVETCILAVTAENRSNSSLQWDADATYSGCSTAWAYCIEKACIQTSLLMRNCIESMFIYFLHEHKWNDNTATWQSFTIFKDLKFGILSAGFCNFSFWSPMGAAIDHNGSCIYSQWSFRKTGTMRTLASQAEIDVCVQAPGTLLRRSGSIIPRKNCEIVYEKSCNLVHLAGKRFAMPSIMCSLTL